MKIKDIDKIIIRFSADFYLKCIDIIFSYLISCGKYEILVKNKTPPTASFSQLSQYSCIETGIKNEMTTFNLFFLQKT